MRARVVNMDVLEAGGEALAWLKEVPYDIRDDGLRDLLKAYKSNLAKRAKNAKHVFEMHFRSKKRLDSGDHHDAFETLEAYQGSVCMASIDPFVRAHARDARVRRTFATHESRCILLVRIAAACHTGREPSPKSRSDSSSVRSGRANLQYML